MRGLEIYGRMERLMPRVLKRRKAHIVYVMLRSQEQAGFAVSRRSPGSDGNPDGD
jgi:hypothetical protein